MQTEIQMCFFYGSSDDEYNNKELSCNWKDINNALPTIWRKDGQIIKKGTYCSVNGQVLAFNYYLQEQ